MSSHFLLGVNAVLPLFILILVGLFIRQKGMLTDEEIRHVNGMVFKIFFFSLMCYNLYSTTWEEAFRPDLILYSVGGLIAVIIFSSILVIWTVKDNPTRGALIQALYRSNFILIGVPLVQNLYGPDQLAIPSMMLAFVVPIYNVTSVIILETFRGHSSFSLKKLLVGCFNNPMIIGAIVGIFFLLTGVRLPHVLEVPLKQIAYCTSPVALILLGASFEFNSLSRNRLPLAAAVAGRLLIIPGVLLFGAYLLGFHGVSMATLIGIFAAPTAVGSFIMAQQMESNYELAGNAVIVSSGLSCFSLFFWIVLMKSLGAL